MGLSTHILDMHRGRPAAGVGVTLSRWRQETWIPLHEATTDNDGRCKSMLPAAVPLEAGLYLLRFETGAYFRNTGLTTLYPYIEITFTVEDAAQHFHVPLLLTANGYTTYRGS